MKNRGHGNFSIFRMDNPGNRSFTFLLILILALCAGQIQGQDLYVSISGNDENTGTDSSPLRTISKALENISGSSAGNTIWIDEGTYRVESTLALSASHSGLTIRALQGKEVIISGGKPILGHLFKLEDDEAELSRIPEPARGKVMVASVDNNLAALFPDKSEYNAVASLSWRGFILNQAQYPNKGFAYISEVLESGPTTRWLEPGEEPEPYSEENPTGGRFQIR